MLYFILAQFLRVDSPMFGILNINKPPEWTSRDVVNRVSRLVGRKVKCGHAGTLDPLATGVLLVCLGKATKLVPFIHEHSKSYEGTFLIGKKSATDDIEGELETVAIPEDFDEQRIQSLLPQFTGEIEQIPPAYSAIKINGERAYKAARRGEDVVMPSREVRIDRLELTQFDGTSMQLSMTCGTGTYVRSIGRDIARKAGTEAVMSALVRTSIGPFALENAVSLDELTKENINEHLHSPLTALQHLPRYCATESEAISLRFGQRIDFHPDRLKGDAGAKAIAVTDDNDQLIAIVEPETTRLAPQIVFPSSE